jgi:hypothetical protein
MSEAHQAPSEPPSEGLHHIGPTIEKVAAQVLQKAKEQDQDKGEAA